MLLYERSHHTATYRQKQDLPSLHKPFTACIAKGKGHKAYEFGNKVELILNPMGRVITDISAFEGNPDDSKTLAPLLDQMRQALAN